MIEGWSGTIDKKGQLAERIRAGIPCYLRDVVMGALEMRGERIGLPLFTRCSSERA